jgi:glycosyltransferase involved in cell wall biosynthesis
LALYTRVFMPALLRGCHVLHMRKIDPNTVLLGSVARQQGIKTVCMPMGGGQYGDIANFPQTARRDAAAYDWVTALSDQIRGEVIDWGHPAARIGVIPNGVDTSFFSPAPSLPKPMSVIFVGKLRIEKRVDVLLSAWKQIQAEFPAATLTLVGGGAKAAEYEHMARDLGISVTFVGDVDTQTVRNLLRQHSVFMLLSVSEGMSNALLEAMSVGVVPVVSDIPGNRALVSHDVNGLLCDGAAPDSVAAGLRRLFGAPAWQQQLSAAARASIVARYDLSHIVSQYEALFQRLVTHEHIPSN